MTTPTSPTPATPATTITPASLRRLRWAVRATLVLGVAVSVTANVLHARPEPIAQAIAAWPPLALLITVDLVSRVPIHRRLLGGVRITATFAIAVIAAFISYGHMAGVASRYGEIGIIPYLLPLSVDGMIVVASVSLVELAGRLRETTPAPPGMETHPPGTPSNGPESISPDPSNTPGSRRAPPATTPSRPPPTVPAMGTRRRTRTTTPTRSHPRATGRSWLHPPCPPTSHP